MSVLLLRMRDASRSNASRTPCPVCAEQKQYWRFFDCANFRTLSSGTSDLPMSVLFPTMSSSDSGCSRLYSSIQ